MQNKLENICEQEQGDKSIRGRRMAEIGVEIDDDDGQLNSGKARLSNFKQFYYRNNEQLKSHLKKYTESLL